MNCPEFNELMAYLDGELSSDRVSVLEEHLAACQDCRRVLESQRKLEEVWRENFSYPSEESFRECENRIGNSLRKRSRWRTVIPFAAAIAAVFLGVKLVLLDGPSLDTAAPAILQAMDSSESSPPTTGDESTEIGTAGVVEDENADRFSESEIIPSESVPEEIISRYYRDETVDDYMAESIEEITSQLGYPSGGTESPDTEHQMDNPGEASVQEGLIGGVSGIDVILSSDGISAGISDIGTMTSSETAADQTSERQLESPQSVTASSPGAGGGASAGYGSAGASGGLLIDEASEEDRTAGETFPADAVGWDGDISLEVDASDEFSSVSQCDAEISLEEESEEECDVLSSISVNRLSDSVSSPAYCEVVSGSSSAGVSFDSAKADVFLCLTFDHDGIPDSLTTALLDSLFAEWSMYIPFAFRDTVLIVPADEVVTLITTSASAVPAQ